MSTCFHFETTGSGLEIIGEWSIQRKSRTLFRAHAKKAARDGGCFEVTRISWQQELSKYHRKQRNVEHNRASTVYRHNRVKEMRTTQNRGFIGYGFGGKDNIQ